MNTTQSCDAFRSALANLDPDSELARELDRQRDHVSVVFHDGKWLYEGLIEVLMNMKRLMMAFDDSIASGLPSNCLDPHFIANFFGLPVEEFNIPTTAFALDAVKTQLQTVEQTVDRIASVALPSGSTSRQPPASKSEATREAADATANQHRRDPSVGSTAENPIPTKKGGRPITTDKLGGFANEHCVSMTFKEIRDKWNELYPDRKTTAENAREARNRWRKRHGKTKTGLLSQSSGESV